METQNNATYSVIRSLSGDGYLVQADAYAREANRDNWDILVSGMALEIAERIAAIYREAGKPEPTQTPSFDDLLTYDMTLPQEERLAEFAELFDLVRVPYAGMWLEGVITEINFEYGYIELDGDIEVEIQDAIRGELIAKADSDSGFIKTYEAWLDKLQANEERLYAVAVQAEQQLFAA